MVEGLDVMNAAVGAVVWRQVDCVLRGGDQGSGEHGRLNVVATMVWSPEGLGLLGGGSRRWYGCSWRPDASGAQKLRANLTDHHAWP